LTFPRHDQLTSAGARELQAVCDKLAPIKTGEAVITPGFALLAKYVIHAADPVYRDGKGGEEAELRAAYTNSLKLDIDVSLVVFDKAAFMVSAELIGDVQSYIDEH
jgi:O-acetyl-ADP-ribose deacetylase (regulator of RNase III)